LSGTVYNLTALIGWALDAAARVILALSTEAGSPRPTLFRVAVIRLACLIGAGLTLSANDTATIYFDTATVNTLLPERTADAGA